MVWLAVLVAIVGVGRASLAVWLRIKGEATDNGCFRMLIGSLLFTSSYLSVELAPGTSWWTYALGVVGLILWIQAFYSRRKILR